MASAASSGAAAYVAPEKQLDISVTSRRGFFGGASAALLVAPAVVAGLVPCANAGATEGATAMNMHATIRPQAEDDQRLWDKLISDLGDARRAIEEFRSRVLIPLTDELDRVAPRAPLYFEVTAKSGTIGRYDLPANDLYAYDDHVIGAIRTAAAACRENFLKRRAAQERLNIDATWAEYDRLGAAVDQLENDLMTMPAPTAAALFWKLDLLFGPAARGTDEDAAGWAAEWINALMADAERLLAPKSTRQALSVVASYRAP